jgi:6-phosphogluconolactonase/glucosamine-6-phosphate isomerase/deaminase
MLINGKNKREAFEKLLNDRITTDCPATLLKLHPNVTVLCDSEAYGE